MTDLRQGVSEPVHIALDMADLRRARLCGAHRSDAPCLSKKALDAMLCTKGGTLEHRRRWMAEAVAWGVLALEAMETEGVE